MQYRTSHQKIYRSTRCPGPSSLSCAAGHGCPSSSRHLHSVLPQLKPVFTSIILYRFDVNIREASVLGLVGAGGIGAPLIFSMNQYAWEKAGAIMLGLILFVWFIDMVSEKSELAIDGQLRFSVFWILFKKSFKPRREISKDFQGIFSFCYFSNFL